MRWFFPEPDAGHVAALIRELGVPPLIARLLALRGFSDAACAARFLSPAMDQLHDPFLMRDMSAAVSRLRSAIARREKVLVYGDYDVDGTMAAVILLTALRSLGAATEAYIPDRIADGYGMRPAVMDWAAEQGFRTVVSVDNGVREHKALGRARELGIDCIVTDHHLPGAELPPACAILNPHRHDCAYPDKNLSGAGVALKLAQALLGTELSEQALRSYMKIAAIGSIADVVPLRGENRVIARFGVAGLSESAAPNSGAARGRAGLTALLALAGLSGKAVSAGDVAFRIAPRLNAAGRMLNARGVIDLFTKGDGAEAAQIAARLEGLNRARQEAEEQVLNEVISGPGSPTQVEGRYSLVFSGRGWHRGVIGIVAQRVVDLHHRPALIIAVENGVGYGSGRSIAGFHLVEALRQSQELFERYGGHAMAAGFTLPAGNIAGLETALEIHARAKLTPADIERSLRADAMIHLAEIDEEFIASLKRLEPFGCGNPAPVFAARMHLAAPPRVIGKNHLRLTLRDGRRHVDAVGWRMGECAGALSQGGEVEVAFTLSESEFRGEANLQLVLKDIAAGTKRSIIEREEVQR